MRIPLVALLFLLWPAIGLLAAPSHGFEITLTNPEMVARRLSSEEMLERIWTAMQENPAYFRELGATVEKVRQGGSGFSILMKLSGGPELEWTTDGRVIEVKLGKPDTATLARFETTVQKAVFDFGARPGLGLVPHYTIGGGHEHMGILESFGADSMLFRNFVVYHLNHPEIGMVLRGRISNEARPLADLSEGERTAAGKVIERFDIAAKSGNPWPIDELSHQMFIALRDASPDGREKQFDINFFSVRYHGTIEMRAGGPFRNAHELVLRAQMRDAILDHVGDRTPLPLHIPDHAPTMPEAIHLFGAVADELNSPGATRQEFRDLVHLPENNTREACSLELALLVH